MDRRSGGHSHLSRERAGVAVLQGGGFPSPVPPCILRVSWGLCMCECVCVCVFVHTHTFICSCQRAPTSIELCVFSTLGVHLCMPLCVCVCTCPSTKCSGPFLLDPVHLCVQMRVYHMCRDLSYCETLSTLVRLRFFSGIGVKVGVRERKWVWLWTPSSPRGHLCASL